MDRVVIGYLSGSILDRKVDYVRPNCLMFVDSFSHDTGIVFFLSNLIEAVMI